MAKAKPFGGISANQLVGQGNTVYHGFSVTTVTATGVINIRDGSITGTIIDVVPIGAAVGATDYMSDGIQCNGGIFVEFNGGATGTLTLYYE